MYYYTNNSYVYYGNKECGTPVREIKTCSDSEAKYWDRLEKACREADKRCR